MKLFCFFTPSHENLFYDWLMPSASNEFQVNYKKFSTQLCPSGVYSEKGWRKTQYEKIQYWIECIQGNMGELIVCCDADIQFLGKSRLLLKSLSKKNDFLFQLNSSNLDVCSGFFVCRCSPKSLSFMTLISDMMKNSMSDIGSGEQYFFNKLLSSNWYNEVNYAFLPKDKFWSPRFKYSSLNELSFSSSILMHHANWTYGVDSKVSQLSYIKKNIIHKSNFWSTQPKNNLDNLKSKNIAEPKIVLCMSSLLRSFEPASYSLVARIISCLPKGIDFVGHFPTQSKNRSNIKVLKKLKLHFNTFDYCFEPDEKYSEEIISMNHNMAHQRHSLEGNLHQWKSMSRCSDMIKKIEKKGNFTYDWIIWIRPDMHCFNSLENILNLNNKHLYFLGHDNHLNGLNDRFCAGNSENMHKRMNIFSYFINSWYPSNHNSPKSLTWCKSKNQFVWNPELVLKSLVDDIGVKRKTINLCIGKLRDEFFATVPYWHSVYKTKHTIENADADIINYDVLNKINCFTPYKMFIDSPWHAVNIMEDISLMQHFPVKKNTFLNSSSIESKILFKNKISNGGFLDNLLMKIEEKKLQLKK